MRCCTQLTLVRVFVRVLVFVFVCWLWVCFRRILPLRHQGGICSTPTQGSSATTLRSLPWCALAASSQQRQRQQLQQHLP